MTPDLDDGSRLVSTHYQSHTRVLVGLAMRFGLSADEASDVVQGLREILNRLPSLEARGEDPEHVLDAVTVWSAVDALPRPERATLYLRYQMDLTFDEISCAIHVEPAAARAYAARARARLRARWGEGSCENGARPHPQTGARARP